MAVKSAGGAKGGSGKNEAAKPAKGGAKAKPKGK